MLDLVIEEARICDGTGRPSFIGTLGVRGDRIAYLGQERGLAAHRRLRAEGLVLAPGFIDPHTHYDAQVAWDPLLTCSPWHGVTTVVMGNCGVGVAPVRPQTRDILLHDLVNVEAIPYEVMRAGIDWQWESYGEYLDAIARRGLGINVAGLVALTPLRHYVMGEASFERAATPEELATMARLLRQAMAAGAFGFSTTTIRNHIGHQGRPLACRNASQEELRGLCRVLREVGRGIIEIALDSTGARLISDADVALLRLLTEESGRPVTWLALFARPGEPDFHQQTIAKLGPLLARAVPQVTPRPLITQGDLRHPFMFASYPSWQPAFNRPLAEQLALYQKPAFREAFLRDMKGHVRHHLWQRMRVLEVANPALRAYCGRTILEIADAEGKRPLDVLLDIGLADQLQTRFQVEAFNYDPEGVARLVTEDRFLIGLSDAGAHVDLLCDVGYATALLEIWVRQRQALTLEKAVHKLTAVPAALFGIPDRGVLALGKVADLVLFDPDTVACRPPEFVCDFPQGGRRLVARAEGIVATFVAGVQLYDHGRHTGALPGRVLRSYETA
ncbi:MAG: amidohydrolase [Candidatus Tectimicrobiota bacterium]|nr:MAG: amidohydrolase [Candidatus Tectomicrobia bacterium]